MQQARKLYDEANVKSCLMQVGDVNRTTRGLLPRTSDRW